MTCSHIAMGEGNQSEINKCTQWKTSIECGVAELPKRNDIPFPQELVKVKFIRLENRIRNYHAKNSECCTLDK